MPPVVRRAWTSLSNKIETPEALRWLAGKPGGAAWLENLADLVATVCKQWDLRPVGPVLNGNVSYVVPVQRHQKKFALKVQWPHHECVHEADALRLWDGDGAIRLVDHDPDHHALLLEWCEPGTSISRVQPSDPIGIVAGLLRRLSKPADEPFRSLAEEATIWVEALHSDWRAAGKPSEQRLVDAAYQYLIDLKDNQGEQVLLHQDLHGDNILAAEREDWLAIDPKPLAGERAFAVSPAIRSFEFGTTRKDTLYRFDRLTEELDIDRERARGWTIGQTMAWAFDSQWSDWHFRTVRWLLEGDAGS